MHNTLSRSVNGVSSRLESSLKFRGNGGFFRQGGSWEGRASERQGGMMTEMEMATPYAHQEVPEIEGG